MSAVAAPPALARAGSSATLEHHGRFRQIDSVRGLACISVLFYHAAFRFPPSGSQLMLYLTQRNSGPPAICLVVFFTISGFVIYRPFVAARWDGGPRPPLLPYATRRIVRIVPAYWVALAVAGAWLSLPYLFTPTGFIRYFGFLQLYGDHRVVSGGIPVSWSLSVELTYYAALPLLALAARRLGRRLGRLGSEFAVLGAMVAASLVYQLIVCLTMSWSNGWKLSVLSFLPGSLEFFAAGMALAILSVDVERRRERPGWWKLVDRRPWIPWTISLAVVYVGGQAYLHPWLGKTGSWFFTHELKPIASFMLLVPLVFGESERGIGRKLLGLRPLVFIGTVSYAFYLWHYQILLKLEGDLIPHGLAYMTVVLIACSVLVGTLSWYLLERPLQRLAARWLRSRATRAARAAPPA